MEDSLIAAEVDARREMIKLKFLELFGEEIDEFRIRVSRGKYKLSHPYREEAEKTAYSIHLALHAMMWYVFQRAAMQKHLRMQMV